MIKTFLNHELHKPNPDKEKEDGFNFTVNKTLDQIKDEVVKYNGEVELLETSAGLFRVIAHCEVYEIQQKMQKLLDEWFNSYKQQ
jgi:hypothetical protein